MATKTLKFVTENLKNLNKTEKELQTEKITAFVEDATIDCSQQISTLETSTIPSLKLKLQREQNALKKAEKAYEVARFAIADDFDCYVSKRELALDNVDAAKKVLASIQQSLDEEIKQLEGFKNILADLTA